MPDQTEILTAALAAGDEDAVESFYRQYFDWLLSQARRASRRDEAFCLDVVQDSVIRILRTVHPVASEVRFRAWLKLVVRTCAWDRMRSEQRRQQRELVAVAVREASEKDDDVIDGEQQAWLKEQIASFDPQIARMIELRYEHRFTLAKISKLLGPPIGTIDGRLRSALKQLRQRAIEDFDE